MLCKTVLVGTPIILSPKQGDGVCPTARLGFTWTTLCCLIFRKKLMSFKNKQMHYALFPPSLVCFLHFTPFFQRSESKYLIKAMLGVMI